MRKLTTILLTTLLALAGCAVNKNIVKPISNNIDYYNAFNDGGQKLFKEAFEMDDPSSLIQPIYLNVGTELPDNDLCTYDEKTISLAGYKGKKVVIEFVAFWCQYCQEEASEYLDELLKDNEDVVFIQCFVEGSKKQNVIDIEGNEIVKDTIKQFYDDANTEMRDDIIIVQQDENLKTVADIIGVTGYPTFVFFDKSGKMSWSVQGLVETDQLSKYYEIAFDNEVKLYDNFRDGLTDAKSVYRTCEDVKNDITDEANERLDSLSLDSEMGEEAFYSNIGASISFENKITDITGKEINLVSDNKNIIFSYLWDSDELEEQVKVLNEWQKTMEDEDVIFVTCIAQRYKDRDVNTIISELKEPINGYILEQSNLNGNFTNLKLKNFSQVFFLSLSKKICIGSYLGDFVERDLEAAYNVMCVENPIYECVKS